MEACMKKGNISSQKNIYDIMHKDRKVARVDETGHCKIY